MERNIRRMCGIEESSRQRGFADFAVEVFYIDFIEAGSSRKASFVLRTKDQLEMFQKSSCTSLSVRVIQRAVTFQKGSVNIVLQQNLPSVPKTNDPQPSTSSEIQPPRKSVKSDTNDSEGDKKENSPKTHLRLRELLLQTKDTRLSEDGKRIECMRCGKSPKLDKCKRTAEGHLKYFRRVHICNLTKTSEQTKKINKYFEPTEKRQKFVASDKGADQSSLFETSESLLESHQENNE